MPGQPPASRPDRGRERWARLALGIAAACGLLAGVYLWQPLRYDFLPRRPRTPLPWTDPESHRLFAPGVRVTLVMAHPDDSELYLSGTLLRLRKTGAVVSLVILTDGDKGYYPFGDPAGLRKVRRAEQDEAGRLWGAREIVYLGGRDGRVKVEAEVIERVAAELRRLRPEYIVTLDGAYPPRLTHRDHRRADAIVSEAARRARVGRWLMRCSTLAPNFAVDVTAEWPRRWAPLLAHRSQFRGRRLRHVRAIITRNARAEGRLLGVPWAEGLRCERLPAW
jgi:LmbE family N-acetylglucosaminyl deacetylase